MDTIPVACDDEFYLIIWLWRTYQMFYFGWSSPIYWRCLPPRLPSPLAGWCPSLWEHRSTLYLHLDPSEQQMYDVGSLIKENGCDKVSDQKPTKSTGSAHRGQASLTLINELGFCGSAKDKKLCLGVPEEQKMSPGPYIININLKLIFKKNCYCKHTWIQWNTYDVQF